MHSTTRVFRLSVALIFSVFSVVTSAAIADARRPVGRTTRVVVEQLRRDPDRRTGCDQAACPPTVATSSSLRPATNLGANGQQVYRRACVTRDCMTAGLKS